MTHKHPAFAAGEGRIVYVREMKREELPDIAGGVRPYAIHDENGQQIGVAPDRALAFAAARQHELWPVSVH